MTEAVIYTRVSSREQQQEGFSLFAQSKLLHDYAQQHNFSIVQAFEDVETAKATGRKQFLKMVEFFRRNACRVLLVEKVDRVTRNFRDAITLEDLDIEIHFVKEGQIICRESKSQAFLIYGFNLVLARHYSNNLREEVMKGMREKAAQGIFPGYAPFGYRNNKGERTIEMDTLDAPISRRIFELYATGRYSLSTLRKAIQRETGKSLPRANLHYILKNRFYIGLFEWGGQVYEGSHPLFIDRSLFENVQAVLEKHNRDKCFKREIAFRGFIRCAYDGGMLTGDVQKEKYIYYHCTRLGQNKCDLPRFREKDIAKRLGEPLQGLQVSQEYTAQIISALRDDQHNAAARGEAQRARLESRLTEIRSYIDKTYEDKLDGKIPEDFWLRKMNAWRGEEQHIQATLERLHNLKTQDRVEAAERIFEIATKAHSLYVAQNDMSEKAKLVRMFVLNCQIDVINVTPIFKNPYNLIFRKAHAREWLADENDWSV